MRARGLLGKVELGDVMLFPYAVVFARQCFWAVGNDYVAWALTLAAASAVWLAHLYAKPEAEEKTPRVFWLVVGLPLLFVYLLRAPLPDLSFDVLNHRLIQGERALRGAQLMPADFFPTIFPFNPASDMLTGLFRHLLGYRLGTVVNLLALLWAGTVLEKLIRPFVGGAALRTLCVLLVLFTEHVLFEINNYMVDLLALPLALEALRLALRYDESEHKRRDLVFSALLLGACVALKLTNAAMVLPVLLVFAVRIFSRRISAATVVLVLVSGLAFLLPLLPHAIYIYAETGSPFFPLYNKLFASPLWPHMNPYDGRWGPRDWPETLLWPFLIVSKPERLSELNVYSGRITLGVVSAALSLVLPRVGARARLVGLATLSGALLWSATSGYIRYALFLELLSGLLFVNLARYAYGRVARLPRPARIAAAALPVALLSAQCALSWSYVTRTEWSKRLTLLDDPGAWRKEARWLWRDRDLMKFQTEEARSLFARVDAWVVSGVKTNGVEVLLRPDVPMLAVNNLEYFDRPDSRRRFARALETLRGKRIYSLSLTEDLNSSLEYLRRRRLVVGEVKTFTLPFFSARTQFHVALIEVGLPPPREVPRRAPDSPEATEATAPLDDEAYQAGLSVAGLPPVMRPGQRVTITVTVKNMSEFVWPSRGRKDYTYLITVGDTWLASDGETLVNNMDGRNTLPRDLWPGEEATVPLDITAPKEPGEYVLEIDLVQEGITFFRDKGSRPLRAAVKVE